MLRMGHRNFHAPALWMSLAAAATSQIALADYGVTKLVSDQPGVALHTDASLVNSWGVAFNPNGVAWVANNHAANSTLYDGLGNPQSLVVQVPGVGGPAAGAPTGVVFNGSANFNVTDGMNTAPARFIFASEDGTISGWAPNVPPPAPSTQAQHAANHSSIGAIYKGLAINSTTTGDRIYATDFHNGRVETLNSSFFPILPGRFVDPSIPDGFAPFGAQQVGSSVFITYAMQDDEREDDVAGAGLGYVDEFDFDGNLIRRFASQGVLNAPWGMALAPSDFGPFSDALLIGNFGDGRINAFDRTTGQLLGHLSDQNGDALEVEGLWGIAFGNGLNDQPTNTLFFASGPDDETHGLYGRIDVVPEPASLMLVSIAALFAGRAARR